MSKTPAGGRKGREKKRRGVDTVYLTILLTLIATGIIVLFSASSPKDYYANTGFAFITRQIMWLGAGLLVMTIASAIDYRKLKRMAASMFFIWIIVMYMTGLIGTARGLAPRWIFGIQPSEAMKFVMIIMYAKIISDLGRDKMKSFRYGVLPLLGLLLLIAGSLVLQKHLSALVIFSAVAFTMIFVGGAKVLPFIVAGGLGVVGVGVLAIAEPYRLKRLMAFLDPFQDPLGTGYHAIQGLYAIGSGGLFGLGLGNSRQKHLYVPEAHNDYIFSIACEELGFFGAVVIITLFALLVWRGIHIALLAPDAFGSMTAFGITILLGLQMLINVGVVTTLLPSTGMQLPFFSSGGSAMVLMLGSVGLMLSISRQMKRG